MAWVTARYCNHPSCEHHGPEISQGCLRPPSGNCSWIYGADNPLMVTSWTGRIDALRFAMASLEFPPSALRPEDMVIHHYAGMSLCPLVDEDTAVFEIHMEGPFLAERRSMLREKIIHSPFFSGGHYEASLNDGFESMNKDLSQLVKDGKVQVPEDNRLWGCGRFSMVAIIHNNTLYTAGASALCVVFKQNTKTIFPTERSDIVLNFSRLKRTGKLLPQGGRYFKSAVMALHKMTLDKGDHVMLLAQNLFRLGQVDTLFQAALKKGLDLREICLETLDKSGNMAIGVTSPLILVKIDI